MQKLIREKEMRISAEVAAYLIKFDSQNRGFPLNEEEIKYHCKVTREYTLINGDKLVYISKHWSIISYESYKESLRQHNLKGKGN